MRSTVGIGLVLLGAISAGCRSVDLEIRAPDSCVEAAQEEITVVVRNNSDTPLGLLSVTLAVGELRLQRHFAKPRQVTYYPEKDEAVTVSVEGVEDIGPAAIMPYRYFEWRGGEDAVLLEHMLLPGDEVEVTISFKPYPHLGDEVTARAELIQVGEVYKPQRSETGRQNVERAGPTGDVMPFIETTITTIYGHMKVPLGSGSYLIRKEDYDSNRRRGFSAQARLDIRALEFTFREAAAKVDFEPQRYEYFRPGGIWLFYHDEQTWFVAPDTVEHYQGYYGYIAGSLMRGQQMIEVEIRDEISEGACPLLGLLFEEGYTFSRTTVHAPGPGREVWHLSKDGRALRGHIRIKHDDLLQFARDLEGWGYRAHVDVLEKR